MIHTVFSLANMIFALAFIVFLGFIYSMIKKESGKWTALLVVMIGLALLKMGIPDREMDNNQKEFALYDSPVIQSNRHLDIQSKCGSFITINHSLELYVPINKNDSAIRIIKQNSYVSGWSAGFKFKVPALKLEQMADNKIKYTVQIYATSRLFGLLNYSDSETFIGEK
ncbi:MAG TPA: hypothetical protein VGK10_00210 [Prolixibacteraceae bacterium]|jgi:hypothetical protein